MLIAAPLKKILEVRQQNHLNKEGIVISSVGSFGLIRNQRLFVETACKLIQQRANLKFMIFSRNITLHTKKLMSWINLHSPKKTQRLLRQTSDFSKLLRTMNIFCLHSKTEDFSNIVREAAITTTPCASINVGYVAV